MSSRRKFLVPKINFIFKCMMNLDENVERAEEDEQIEKVSSLKE